MFLYLQSDSEPFLHLERDCALLGSGVDGMSRRRRRDDGETDGDILSEDEGPNDRVEKLPHPLESDLENDDLDVSDYESLDEETKQSSDEVEQSADEPLHQTEVKVEDNEVKVEDNEAKVEDNEVKVEDNEVKVEDNEVKVEDSEVKVEDNQTKAEVDAKPQRESGDGKEDTKPHKDEDHAEQESGKTEDNQKEEDDPAFIPTKGTFFQHDVRSDDQPKGRGRDRKIWDKEPVKWIHDMFVMEEQMPKSRDILISNYGFDIRDKPLNGPPPPSDARRIRGRGRGGGYRGRGRCQNVQSDQRRAESTNQNRDSDSKEEYPALNNATNRDSRIKLKSKSYYKRNTNNQPVDSSVSRKVKDEPGSRQQKGLDPSLMEKRKPPSESTKTSEEREDERLSDLLEVINNRENTPSNKEPASTTSSNSRRGERHPKNSHQSTAFSNYQEAPKPRRSLRQRQTYSPVDKQSSRYSPSLKDDRYANFSKPVQPSQSTNFTNISYEFKGGTAPVQNQTTPQEPKYAAPMPQTTAAQPTVIQPPLFSDPSIASMGAPLDQNLMQMPLQYNPMLNTMYEAAAYQRMMQMMSQQMLQMNMNMDQLPQLPTSLPPPMDSTGAATQSLPHPSDMQINPLLPPVPQTLSQGTFGSVMRPPPAPLIPPAYFAG